MTRYTITHWPADAGQVTINKIRAHLEQEGLYPSRFDMVPGDSYGDHSHPEAEIRWVVSGRMKIRIREGARPGAPGAGGCKHSEELILAPGDRLDLTAGVVHSAEVAGDEVVVTVCASR